MLKKLLTRPYIISAALALQVLWLFFSVVYLSEASMAVSFFVQVVSVVALLYILNQPGPAELKLPWAILILTTPIFGGIIYFLTAGEGVSKKQRDAYRAAEKQIQSHASSALGQELPALRQAEPVLSGQFACLERRGFPLYGRTATRYYGMADDAFPDLLADLERAEQYIFLEYFIIARNSMWLEILAVLERKAAQGVEVRVLYDDMATMSQLPRRYPRELEGKGIRCIAFNPFIPVCTAVMNHRDHRKIAVIDGKIAFTGGFNLSDEYINRAHPYGQSWKDTGVRLEGDAAYGLTLMFLTMWEASSGFTETPEKYRPANWTPPEGEGLVQPYAHTPLAGGQIVGDLYCNLINQSSRYLYIYTPYLIPNQAVMDALCLAADRGVDVRLILPGVPDKKIISQLTKAHYARLLEHGVGIHEYEPGFVHAKCLVCDDKIASVGTANLDCRSLYHSFENGCLFYRAPAVEQLRRDFLTTLAQCRQATGQHTRLHIFSSVYYAILRVLSPLL